MGLAFTDYLLTKVMMVSQEASIKYQTSESQIVASESQIVASESECPVVFRIQ